MSRRSAALAALLFAVLPGWAAIADDRPNLVVILVDTLRADRLQPYGAERPTSPFFAALAEKSVVFTAAVSNATWTRSALPTLFTSLSPLVHGKVVGVEQAHGFVERLDDEVVTLPELLQHAGYATGGIVTWDKGAGFYSPEFGLRQGFNYVNDPSSVDGPQRNLVELRDIDERIVRHTLSWLARRSDRQQPVFLWVHLFGAHGPFEPPPAYETLFTPPDLLRFVRAAYGHSYHLPYELLARKGEELDYVKTQYDANIRFIDDLVRGLIEGIERRVSRDTVLLVLADHGEAFFELPGQYLHGEGNFPCGPLTRIPFIVYAPGRFAPRRVPEVVSQLDVLPTLAALAGIEPPPGIEGRSLVPLLGGDGPWPERVVPIHSGVFVLAAAAITEGKKYLYLNPHNVLGSPTYFQAFETLGEAVYDLAADPGERFNVLFYHGDFARRMRRYTEVEYLSRMFGWHLVFRAGPRPRRLAGVLRADVPVYRMNARYVGAEAIDVRRAVAHNLLRKQAPGESGIARRLIGRRGAIACPRDGPTTLAYDVVLPRGSTGHVFVFGVHAELQSAPSAVRVAVQGLDDRTLRQIRVARGGAGWLWNRFVPTDDARAIRVELTCESAVRLRQLFFAREPLAVAARPGDERAFDFSGEAVDGAVALNFATQGVPSTLALEASVDGVPVDAGTVLVYGDSGFAPAQTLDLGREALARARIPQALRPADLLTTPDRFYLYSAGPAPTQAVRPRPETIDMLRALGYVGGP